MTVIFKERYSIDEVKSFICSKVTHVILGKSEEARSKYFYEYIKTDYEGKILQIEIDVRRENILIIDEIFEGKLTNINKGYLVHDLESFIKPLLAGATVCIDISGIKYQLLFILVKILKRIGISRLFAVYTEPQDYEKAGLDEDHYSLTEDFLGIRTVPGYAGSLEKNRDFILVPILGFEGNRFQAIYDHIQPPRDRIVPIIGFPAFQPGWKAVTLSANRAVLEATGCSYEAHFIYAACPFEIYDHLMAIRSNFKTSQLVIAPLGPRPLALGCALYLLRDNNCLLIHDNPVEREYRTQGTGKCHFYHLTSLI
jgi:hypothetical protein